MLKRNSGTKIILFGLIALLSGTMFIGCSESKYETKDNYTEEENMEQIDTEEVSSEYVNAVAMVNDYVTQNKMASYDLIYEVLVKSPYNLSHKAAKYGLDNCEADWNKHALESAIIYATDYSYSKDKIKEVLCSVDKFKEEEAEYAINNLGEIDWTKNAINIANELKANNSKSSVYKKLISDEYMFTDSEAKAAVDSIFVVKEESQPKVETKRQGKKLTEEDLNIYLVRLDEADNKELDYDKYCEYDVILNDMWKLVYNACDDKEYNQALSEQKGWIKSKEYINKDDYSKLADMTRDRIIYIANEYLLQ